MFVILPHGTCVDPEIVKFITVRTERANPNAPAAFAVLMKTDADDQPIILAKFDNHAEAADLAIQCAKLINKGPEEETSDSDDTSSDDASSADDDDW